MSTVLMVYYCALIVAASVLGGMAPLWLRLSHRWMECAVSFVAGVMLGIALLHLLPHAVLACVEGAAPELVAPRVSWALGTCLLGFLTMFFVERFLCFHHHDVPEQPADQGDDDQKSDQHCVHHHGGANNEATGCCEHDHAHTDHATDLTWSGAALGLGLHSVIGGIGLAASVVHEADTAALPGFGVFLATVLHKPFDAMTISTLMARGGYSVAARLAANALFALAIPVGVAMFLMGIAWGASETGVGVGLALAFASGMFLCISMSDLLPELQFHHHDRLKLSAALLLGLAVAIVAAKFESLGHRHPLPQAQAEVGR